MKKIIFIIAIFFSFPTFAATVQEVKTAAGFTAWLVEEHSQPLISVSIAFRDSGVAYDAEAENGRVAMVSELLSEGVGDMDAKAFSLALENSAVRLNFSADYDNFYASLESLSENKEKAFAYLGLALTNPRFDDSAVERVKSRTLAAIKEQQEKPAYRLGRAWQAQLFGKHAYSYPELGTQEIVQKLTAKDFRRFTSNYLSRENIIISVVGDITAAELSVLLDKNLEKLPAKYNSEIKISDIAIPDAVKQIVVDQDIPQTMVRFALKGLKRDDPEFITGFVLNYMLGGSVFGSRLGSEIREKRGLAYSVSSALTPMRHAAIWQGSFATRNEKVGEAVAVLKNTIKEFAENGVSEKELEDAKKFLTGSFIVGLDSNGSIVNFITMMQLQNLGIDYIERRNNLIRATTRQQINQLAKRLIDVNKLQIVMVGKPNLETTTEKNK